MKIFVSYPASDSEIVHTVVDFLEQNGHTIWIWYKHAALEAPSSKEQRREMRQHAIEGSDLVLVIVSAHFSNSIGVPKEIIYAQYLNKPILPLQVEAAQIPFSLLAFNILDVSENFPASLHQLTKALENIQALLPQKDKPDTNTITTEELAQSRDRIWTDAPMERVFIAYARKQRPAAQIVCDLLLKHGKAVFYDAKIKAGATWRQTIQRALDDATHLVVIWTPDAAQSDEVEREVSYALAEGKVIVPVLSKDVSKLTYHLHGLHYILLEDDPAAIETDLLKAIAQFKEDEDIWQ